jgi:hypothetical protein
MLSSELSDRAWFVVEHCSIVRMLSAVCTASEDLVLSLPESISTTTRLVAKPMSVGADCELS